VREAPRAPVRCAGQPISAENRAAFLQLLLPCGYVLFVALKNSIDNAAKYQAIYEVYLWDTTLV
jgi:hypothetical protein